jgi:hypothetical protein
MIRPQWGRALSSAEIHQIAKRIPGWIMLREVHHEHWDFDLTGIQSILESQLHAVGLALDAVEQYAGHCLFATRDTPLLHCVHRAGERGRNLGRRRPQWYGNWRGNGNGLTLRPFGWLLWRVIRFVEHRGHSPVQIKRLRRPPGHARRGDDIESAGRWPLGCVG